MGKVDLILHITNLLKLRHDHFVSAGGRRLLICSYYMVCISVIFGICYSAQTVFLGLLHDDIASETNVGNVMIFSLCNL